MCVGENLRVVWTCLCAIPYKLNGERGGEKNDLQNLKPKIDLITFHY